MEVTSSTNAAASERWERDYALLRDAISKAKRDDEVRQLDARVKRLEAELANLADDGSLAQKRRKIAEATRSLLLKQSEGVATVSMYTQPVPGAISGQSLESMLEEQRESSRAVDRRVVSVQRDVGEVHAISTAMRDTVNLQAPLLDQIEDGMHTTIHATELDTRRVREVAKASDVRALRCTIFALVVIFIVMLFIKVS